MNCYCVLPDPSRELLLLKKSAGGWALPSIEVDADLLIAYQSEQVRNLLREKVGCDAIVLQKLVSVRKYHCLEMDLQSPFQANPLVYQWHGYDRLATLNYDSEQTSLLVQNWLKQNKDPDAKAALSPSQKTGWFQGATQWIDQQLEMLGWLGTGPVLQVKGGQHNSCLLYRSTDAGDIFFKAGSRMLPVESQLTAELAQRFPGEIPEFLAADHEQNWMLMRDFGNNHLGLAGDHLIPPAAKRMAEIQISTSDSLARWKALGCENWDEQGIYEHLDQAPGLLAQFDQGRNIIDPQLLDDLSARIPDIKKLITELFDSSLPLTLVHIEFHTAHVLVNEPGFVFHDWDGCVVTHPFHALHCMLFSIENDKLAASVQEAFCEPFLEYEDERRLHRMSEVAGKLFWLFIYLNVRRYLQRMTPQDHRRERFLANLENHLRRGLSQLGRG